eukprot:31018-Pelagococcus_subviridis.AAC.10
MDVNQVVPRDDPLELVPAARRHAQMSDAEPREQRMNARQLHRGVHGPRRLIHRVRQVHHPRQLLVRDVLHALAYLRNEALLELVEVVAVVGARYGGFAAARRRGGADARRHPRLARPAALRRAPGWVARARDRGGVRARPSRDRAHEVAVGVFLLRGGPGPAVGVGRTAVGVGRTAGGAGGRARRRGVRVHGLDRASVPSRRRRRLRGGPVLEPLHGPVLERAAGSSSAARRVAAAAAVVAAVAREPRPAARFRHRHRRSLRRGRRERTQPVLPFLRVVVVRFRDALLARAVLEDDPQDAL